jgi:hypothetical protein
VLGDLQVVAANGLDGAADAGGVGQLDAHRLPTPGQLAQRERELVAADEGGWRSSGSAGSAIETAGP